MAWIKWVTKYSDQIGIIISEERLFDPKNPDYRSINRDYRGALEAVRVGFREFNKYFEQINLRGAIEELEEVSKYAKKVQDFKEGQKHKKLMEEIISGVSNLAGHLEEVLNILSLGAGTDIH